MLETINYTFPGAELDILCAASAAPSKRDFILFPSPEASKLIRETADK